MILMKLPKVDGDIKIAGYEKWFVCTSISWGIERNFDESGATGTFDVKLGVPMWTDSIVEIEKTVDESSPDLFRSAVAGGILGDVVEIDFVEQIEEGGEAVNQSYMKFKLASPAVKGWNFSGSEDDRPTETIQLWYNALWLQTNKYDKNGAVDGTNRGWSRVGSKSWDGAGSVV